MKSLPNVTLISYDNTEDPTRTLRALQFSAREIQFADVVLVCKAKPASNGVTLQRVHEQGYKAAMVWEVAGVNQYVQTDFALCIHHDGYVINPKSWRDDWLQYDFIGAPWPASSHPCHPGKSNFPHGRVGNTGCCLKSKAFMQRSEELRDLFVRASKRPDQYGQQYAGDTFCCQHQRPALEQLGITFAPVEVAAGFAWESNIEEVPGDRPYAFGFHNFHLEEKQVPERMIPDPQNVFELLQNDVATQIMATSPFSSIANPDGTTPFKVLTEDEGDIQFEYDQMIQQLGLSIVVHSPAGRIEQPDLPGPLITKLGFDVWVSESADVQPLRNGTQIRLWKATTIVLGTLHGFQPQSINSPVYADEVRLERERSYIEGEGQPGTLIVSRICHFIAPQVAAVIGT